MITWKTTASEWPVSFTEVFSLSFVQVFVELLLTGRKKNRWPHAEIHATLFFAYHLQWQVRTPLNLALNLAIKLKDNIISVSANLLDCFWNDLFLF